MTRDIYKLDPDVGYSRKCWGLDFAWQYDLPIRRKIGASLLRSGEYSNSSVEVSTIAWL